MTAIWAHRGASADEPENTLRAFRLAAQQGADGVELDVQLSADGELVVMHDETLDRTTDGHGRLVDRTLAEVRTLDAGRGARVPTLAEVLEALRPSNLLVNVELKNTIEPYPGMEEKVLDLVAAAGFADRVLVSSFNHYSLKIVRGLSAGTPVGLLYQDVLYEPWDYAHRFGADALHPHHLMLQVPDYVARAHALGIAVNVWTVNEEAAMADLLARGVDAIITDHPARALRVRG